MILMLENSVAVVGVSIDQRADLISCHSGDIWSAFRRSLSQKKILKSSDFLHLPYITSLRDFKKWVGRWLPIYHPYGIRGMGVEMPL